MLKQSTTVSLATYKKLLVSLVDQVIHMWSVCFCFIVAQDLKAIVVTLYRPFKVIKSQHLKDAPILEKETRK